jgi:hypothetical protein
MLLGVGWCLFTDVSGYISVSYSRVKQSKKNCLTLQVGTEMSRNVGTQSTKLHCLTSPKNESLSHTMWKPGTSHMMQCIDIPDYGIAAGGSERLAGDSRWNRADTDLWTE